MLVKKLKKKIIKDMFVFKNEKCLVVKEIRQNVGRDFFDVSEEDAAIPVVANMSRRVRYIIKYSPVGIFPAATRSILRLQDLWG